MSSKWVRKDDLVCVISGKFRGKTGKVLAKRGGKVVVEGINKKFKCCKKSQAHPKGAIIQVEAPIDISNIALCDESGSRVKVRVRVYSNGQKSLVYVKDGSEHVFRVVRKSEGVQNDVT